MKKTLYLLICIAQISLGQDLLVKNAEIHCGNGQVISKGFLWVKSGKIESIGSMDQMPNVSATQTIDASGKMMYPGLIAMNTGLGLIEIEAVRATADFREVGYFNPNIRSLIAYNTDSEIIPTVKSNGILYAQITPQGGRISGQSSVVRLAADNWEDAQVKADNGIHLNWPNRYQRSYWWSDNSESGQNKNYHRDLEGLQLFMEGSLSYYQTKERTQINQRFEAMKGLFDQSKQLYIHTDEAKSIMEAFEFFKKYNIKPVFVGAAEAGKIISYIKENKIQLILINVQSLPNQDDDDIDLPFKLPSLLHSQGISFALSVEGSWQQRNLMFHAGQAVSFGLDKEAAISAITLFPAQILGIDKEVGSLEKGKKASFILSKGDILDMRTSQVEEAFIDGKPIDLNDKQKDLYKKYKEKFQLKN